MPESTSEQRDNWRAYECNADKMVRIQFGPDRILVAPPTVDAWAALATVLSGHGYVLRTPDTDSYNCRAIKGGSGRSLHSFGIALDVNWDTNPYKETPNQRAVKFSPKATQGERGEDVRLGRADTDMTPAMIADVLGIKTKNGKRVFEWGGNWKTVKDTMHFEIDVGPDDLASGIDPNSIGTGGPPSVVVASRPILKRGSIGETVKLVQTALMIDGIFGADTENAVRRFQRYHGLDDDGIIGPDTWQRLEPLLAPTKPIEPAEPVESAEPEKPPAPPDARLRMGQKIVDFEARRDSAGRIMVYDLPAGDGGGAYEVAGINERYHKETADRLVALIRAGQHAEAERLAAEFIADYTDIAAKWTNDPAVEFYLRDSVFNRGPTGAMNILQRAVGTGIDGEYGPQTEAAVKALSSTDLLTRLRSAREEHERNVVGRDESSKFWKGLVNRWNNALAAAKTFAT